VNKKLNVGCGKNIKSGWINLDIVDLPGVDVVYNIENLPLPFDDDMFDIILCQDVLEHIEYIPVIRDLHRILKKGGKLQIRVPHFSSRRNYEDPTHRKMFSIRTFEFFINNSYAKRDYYFDYHFERISYSKIIFEKHFFFYNYLIEMFVNSNRRIKKILFEATFLSRLFPAEHIALELIK
jgi:SAM-dependent methyltransferase